MIINVLSLLIGLSGFLKCGEYYSENGRTGRIRAQCQSNRAHFKNERPLRAFRTAPGRAPYPSDARAAFEGNGLAGCLPSDPLDLNRHRLLAGQVWSGVVG